MKVDRARIVEILRAKRDGQTLSGDDLSFFATHIASGAVSDTQLGAFATSAFIQGLSFEECATLTRAMAASGWTADWSEFDLDGPLLDKHSTGGLGDIVSFLLAPMVAACGGYVPMISGRSLGHTGGTVDKLESIPGYDVSPEPERFQEIVAKEGLAIVSQTSRIVPADQRLYAARDQTSTVDSIPLITASILSKKVAEGGDGLVIDIKVGNGAFMESEERGRSLRTSMEQVAKGCGLRCRAYLTDMNQPLANCVGDAVELREAVRFLTGERRTSRLHETAMQLSAGLLQLGGIAANDEGARRSLEASLESGQAAERFQRMISALGGPADFIENVDAYLVAPKVTMEVPAERSGRVTGIDCRSLGNAVHVAAGADDGSLDHPVGVSEICEIGQRIETGQPLAMIHARSEEQAAELAARVAATIGISEA